MQRMGAKGIGSLLATAAACLCANGEAPAVVVHDSEVIPCQAGEGFGSPEGVETRRPSPNSTAAQECPAPDLHCAEGEEIVRHSVKAESASKQRASTACTYEMDEIKLFKSIPKVPATNTVEEFNRLISYGRGGSKRFNLGWMTEGDLPEEEDSTYERVTMLIKYLGVQGRVFLAPLFA